METAQPKVTMQQRLIKWGVAKTEAQATYILLGVALVAVVLAFLWPLFAGVKTPPASTGPDPSMAIPIPQRP